ncbi:MAG: nuclear transport factor 2 family protein [Actinomycetota bacterium]|nr:nuclear transport factor 2 family protein [Actinomycetota bacterium]
MTKADENAEIVRQGYEAFNAADIEALTRLFADNSTWHTPVRSSIAGDARGRDVVFAHFGRYGGETAGTSTTVSPAATSCWASR